MTLSLSKEHSMIHQVHALETRASEAIAQVPDAAQMRDHFTDPKLTTRQGFLHALEETVEYFLESSEISPVAKQAVRRAKTLLTQAVAIRWDLVLAIEGLVRKEARRFSRLGYLGYDDLMQEGYIGALNAARRFEPSRRVRFPTYARWWIRANITKSIERQGRLVRIPGGAVELMRNIRRSIADQEQAGLQPDLNMVANDLGISRARVDQLLSYKGAVSLDKENIKGQTMDIPDENLYVNPEYRVIQNSSFEACSNLVMQLDGRQKYIIERHFGIHGQEVTSLQQIGMDLGISRERARQLQKIAISRIALPLGAHRQ